VVDDVRGRVVEVYVSLKPGFEANDETAAKVSKTIETVIGKIARPKHVWIVPDMPKTRSGKIMRRVIASVSNFTDVGDVTTLANPEIVEQIREQVQSTKEAKGEAQRELTEAEQAEIKAFGSESRLFHPVWGAYLHGGRARRITPNGRARAPARFRPCHHVFRDLVLLRHAAVAGAGDEQERSRATGAQAGKAAA
jgi:hypothetical protein